MSRVLLIDSDTSSGALLESTLKEMQIDLTLAESGADGLQQLLERPPTLIMLALDLPDMDGLEVLRTVRSRTRTVSIPVMIIATRHTAARQSEALQTGADDFIMKPFDTDIVSLRIRNAVQRVLRDGVNNPLTGLPTGRLLQERIRELADEFGWYKIDLEIESFSPFTEAYGFMTGQEVVNFTAGLLADCVHDAGTPNDFIGQRSDTGYVIVTTLAHGEALAAMLETRFNEGIQSFYNFMEREQGFIELDDGHGNRVQHPLMRAKIKSQQGEEE